MFCKELVHCGGIKLASRNAKTPRKSICRAKYFVGDGYGCFHTKSITSVILVVKRLLSKTWGKGCGKAAVKEDKKWKK
jgi:hypothetical protein